MMRRAVLPQLRNWRLSFDPWGLLLFLGIMLPNFIWFAVPAPDDILRGESVTEALDAAAAVLQVLFAAALCLLSNGPRRPLRAGPLLCACVCCWLLYLAGWAAYYLGFAGPTVILALAVLPCLSFLFFALERRNFVAAVLIAVFAVCHLISSLLNFL